MLSLFVSLKRGHSIKCFVTKFTGGEPLLWSARMQELKRKFTFKFFQNLAKYKHLDNDIYKNISVDAYVAISVLLFCGGDLGAN